MKLKITLLYVLCFISMSCNFNKLLVHPGKIPADKKSEKIVRDVIQNGKVTGHETTIVHFGDNFQPSFRDVHNNVKDPDYTVESVVFKNNAGKNLNGWMIKPKNIRPTITLLFLHGNGGNIITHYSTILPLVEKGFQVFIFDYSGFGFSEGKATRKHGLADGVAALRYLHSREDVKNTGLIIYGQSMGAHFAPGIAVSDQALADGMVIEGGFLSWKAVAAHHVIFGFVPEILIKEDYNVTTALRQYKKPVLVIHSSDDETVPVSMGIKLFNAAYDPKTYFEIAKCHACGPIYYSEKISEKIRSMVNK